jgi:hypothetical protein
MAKNNENEKYAYLNRLSTQQLEELLRADIESPESGDKGVIFHILEVIESREEEHPTGRLPDEDKAWEEFQEYYNIPEGEGLSLYPIEDDEEEDCTTGQTQRSNIVRLFPMLKLAGIVMTVVIGAFGLMVGAQAAGIDVFGAIGRWTNETFRFAISSTGVTQDGTGVGSPSAQKDNGYYTSLQTALNNCGITVDLAPTKYPDGFEMSEPKILSTDFGDKILCGFSAGEDKFFSIQIWRYTLASDLNSHNFEKDGATVEDYTTGEKTFYIMSNMDTTTATWSDGNSLVLSITGNISDVNIKIMIDSIGG